MMAGAVNMNSEKLGLQVRLKKGSKIDAMYMNYSGHCLNLVIPQSCALLIVLTVLDRMKAVVLYF